MAGGKTSKKTSEINENLANIAANNYAMAQDIARLGYQPNRGVTVAAFTPQQEAAMRGTNAAATAFGLPSVADPMAGMPAPETSAGGVRGYSSGADYDQMLARLPAGYRGNIDAFFANPNAPMVRTTPMTEKRNSGGKK